MFGHLVHVVWILQDDVTSSNPTAVWISIYV